MSQIRNFWQAGYGAVGGELSVGEIPASARAGLDELTGHMVGCGCAGCCDRVEPDKQAQGEAAYAPVSTSTGATLGVLADYLRVGYWQDAGTIPRKFNLTDTGYNPNNGVLEYNLTGFSNLFGVTDGNGISNSRKALVRDAFDIYSEVLGISFVETASSTSDFFFSDNQSGAYSTSAGNGSGISYSLINVQSSWSGGTSTYNDYTLQTILHEIGHSLGLGHQGLYNGSASFPSGATFANDSWQASMMSYFSQGENTNVNATTRFLQTPMAVDWIALNDIYGGDVFGGQTFGTQNAFNGDTTYGFNNNISASVSGIWAEYFRYANKTASTIIDADGNDTLDLNGYSADQLINLTVTKVGDLAAAASNIGGRIGNLTLAAGTVIENATGGSGDDVFYGNDADNVFRGNGGNDSFNDSAGSDTYYGDGGTDSVYFAGRFSDYTVSVTGSFLNLASSLFGAAVDFVENTIEWLDFAGQLWGYGDVAGTAGPPANPVPTQVVSIAAIADDAGTIQGAVPDGGMTDDLTPTLSGTLSVGLSGSQALVVFRDGVEVGVASVTGTTWAFADSGLAEGNHIYTALVRDGGQTGALSASYSMTLDRTAPSVGIDPLATTDTTPTLSGAVDDAGASVTVTVAGLSASATNNGNGTWTLADGVLPALAAATYDVAVTAVDAIGNVGSDNTMDELTILPSSGAVLVEFGSATVAQKGATSWHSVSFSDDILNAVVVMGPVSFNGKNAATARVRNVTDTGFEFQIEEWDYLDGKHFVETVGWMAASAGTHQIGGLTVSAGTAMVANQASDRASFDTAFAAAPIIFAQVASDNDSAAVVTRILNVASDGFDFHLQEEEAADGTHAAEDIDWIAIELGDGAAFDAARTGDSVTNKPSALDFAALTPGSGVFLAGMQTEDGTDPSSVRVNNMTSTGVDVFVLEEQSRDAEIRHTDEVIGYLTADQGVWFA